MDSTIGGSIIFFFSISKGSRILYSHSLDRNLESIALAALQTAPPFHSRYSHTAGDRTFAFLFDDDGHTYFAIAEPSYAALRFLELMRDGFRNSADEGLIPIIHDSLSSSASLATAEAPLLSRNGIDDEEKRGSGEIWLEMAEEPARPRMPLQKSLSARTWMLHNGTRLWWRQVKIVIIIDALFCFVLLGIWLAVCRGFQCVG